MSASTAATPALTRGNPKILRFLSDDRLAALAARGTPDAFALIYERHHQGIYRYCRSILGNAHDASDALQNTMTSVLQALPGERREIALKSWLYRIAHNESISLLRRRRPQVDLKHAEALPAPDMAEDIASRERMAQLWSDLEELPERQRAALVMRELSGLSHDEIAASLEVSPGAAKQAVFEARQALRDLGGGRAMDCRHVQERISDGDGRRLWARKIRSHLRSCDDCQAFQVALGARRNDLAALAPPLAPAAAAALLHGVVGGGGAGTGGGLLSLLGGGAGKAAGATTAFKMSAAVAVSVVAGGTAAVASHEVRSNRDERPAEARADRADAGTRGSTARSPGGGPDERRREKRTPSSAAADSAGERSRERKAASNRGGHRRRVRPAKPTRPQPPAHPAAGRAGSRPTRRTPSPARGSAPAAGNAGTARGGRGSASATAPTPPTPSAPTPPAPPVTPPARPSAAP